MAMDLDRLFALLINYRSAGVFNQYRQTHLGLDRVGAADVRCRNLALYLDAFSAARYVMVGEAAGFAGCRFSGIPFTSEAQLVGPEALSWTDNWSFERSSSAAEPWDERSARMIWSALGARRDCLLWNAFPWHPFGASGPLSNRAPGPLTRHGLEALGFLLSQLPRAAPVAVGRVAQTALATLGIVVPYVRHPSHGGKREFTAVLERLLNE